MTSRMTFSVGKDVKIILVWFATSMGEDAVTPPFFLNWLSAA